MSDDDALTLKKGRHVMHLHTMPPCRPLRVTEAAPTHTGRVMIRIASIGSGWFQATEYALPRKGWKVDTKERRWINDQGGALSVVPDLALRERWKEQVPS